MHDYRLEQLKIEDAGQLLALSQQAQWSQTLEDWQAMLKVGSFFGHRSEEGEIVSSAGIFCYGKTLASIGMVLVRTDMKKQGFGRKVVEQCLAVLPESNMLVTLVASPEGFLLYKKLGFETIAQLYKFSAEKVYLPDRLAENQTEYELSSFTENSLKEAVALDQKVNGADREQMLKARLEQASGGVIVRDPTGKLSGFSLSVKQRQALIIGPLVAPNAEIAIRMIHFLASDFSGIVRLDVPEHQTQLLEWLPGCGFEETTVSPVMLLNGEKLPGDREFLFGITNVTFG